MNINLESERFKQTLKMVINDSNLPIVIIKYTLEELTTEIQKLYKQSILQALNEKEEKQQSSSEQD